MNKNNEAHQPDCDVVLIGAGIMSATLGVFLKELDPTLKVEIYERLDKVAAESSDAWNNAGTGHSALCELNYTPENPDGSIDISKALKIVESFEVSKQFWAYLFEHGYMGSPREFINSVPHMSFVWGEENVDYLKRRHEAMTKNYLFRGMEFSSDHAKLREWIPLVMNGRDEKQVSAATYMPIGTDLNFGVLTRSLFNHLNGQHDVAVNLRHEVHHLHREKDGTWRVGVTDLASGHSRNIHARFVFIGAGGGSLPLLEKSNIHEGKGFGGFPVGGEWLICKNKEVIAQHHAKVYGKPAVGSPPMSMPHLDTRVIDGEKALLFGPYATFSTRFLKQGSLLDLPLSIHLDNIVSMLGAGIHNLPLTKYLIEQLIQSPEAKMEDWEPAIAGQRVQVIKHDQKEGGILEFGTEVVHAEDGSIAALLGASPGASTSVPIMLGLIEACFADRVKTPEWQSKLKEMIPSYGKSLSHDEALAMATRKRSHEILELTQLESAI
jgi:malate dehydrogenase (quinone)